MEMSNKRNSHQRKLKQQLLFNITLYKSTNFLFFRLLSLYLLFLLFASFSFLVCITTRHRQLRVYTLIKPPASRPGEPEQNVIFLLIKEDLINTFSFFNQSFSKKHDSKLLFDCSTTKSCGTVAKL